jgi:small-conductance mechanosensitive channel
MQILKAAVDSQMGVLKQPDPFIRFGFWRFIIKFFNNFSEELFRVENIKSEMRIKIFELFKTNAITIPFPQRVVHINK